MAYIDGRSDARHATADAAEYSGDVPARHRDHAHHVSSRRLRLGYFGVAALWGFIVGTGGILVALQAGGQVFVPSAAGVLTYAVLGAAVAIGGSVVIASAYQESRRRR
jgi:hypothetical protein